MRGACRAIAPHGATGADAQRMVRRCVRGVSQNVSPFTEDDAGRPRRPVADVVDARLEPAERTCERGLRFRLTRAHCCNRRQVRAAGFGLLGQRGWPPFKDILTNHGFTFKNTVNDQPLRLWLRVEPEGQPDMDADDFEALFEQYGLRERECVFVSRLRSEDEDEDA